jgi:hypothetical protein
MRQKNLTVFNKTGLKNRHVFLPHPVLQHNLQYKDIHPI